MIVEFLLLVAFLLILGSTGLPLLSGLPGILLIGGVIVLGLLAPFILDMWVGRAGDRFSVLVALISILTLLGGFLFRTTIVLAGQGLI